MGSDTPALPEYLDAHINFTIEGLRQSRQVYQRSLSYAIQQCLSLILLPSLYRIGQTSNGQPYSQPCEQLGVLAQPGQQGLNCTISHQEQFGWVIQQLNRLLSKMIAEEEKEITSFDQLPLCEALQLAVKSLKYTIPTPIQAQTLPYTLKGKDVIALAETGSGKTLAFALPILEALLDRPTQFFALILSPTKELCVQIGEHFKALGRAMGLKVATIIGGLDLKDQVKSLTAKPHIVVGTPGIVVYHMENTKAYNYRNTKFLVMDEADQLLSQNFEKQINRIVEALPTNRNTFLFSATMTNKVEKLQRASLRDPVKISVSKKYQTVKNLKQEYIFIPNTHKDVYLAYLINQKIGNEIIIFTLTCLSAMKVCLLLRKLGHKAVTVNGQMTQNKRLGSLARFKSRDANILVATDVASRGLDIPEVDLVINYDLPLNPKDYIHRVGRTARAGRAGRSLSIITQYDVELVQRIEQLIQKKLELFYIDSEEVQAIKASVDEKSRAASEELKLKLQKNEIDEEKLNEKYGKYGKQIQKKKIRNKKRRTKIDI